MEKLTAQCLDRLIKNLKNPQKRDVDIFVEYVKAMTASRIHRMRGVRAGWGPFASDELFDYLKVAVPSRMWCQLNETLSVSEAFRQAIRTDLENAELGIKSENALKYLNRCVSNAFNDEYGTTKRHEKQRAECEVEPVAPATNSMASDLREWFERPFSASDLMTLQRIKPKPRLALLTLRGMADKLTREQWVDLQKEADVRTLGFPYRHDTPKLRERLAEDLSVPRNCVDKWRQYHSRVIDSLEALRPESGLPCAA